MNGIEKTSTQKWVAALSAVKKDSKNAGLSVAALKFVSKPRKERVSITLGRLNKYASDSENIIVPGKILATGVLGKKFTVAAIEYSTSATHQLKAAGCQVVSLEEMLKKDGVRLIV